MKASIQGGAVFLLLLNTLSLALAQDCGCTYTVEGRTKDGENVLRQVKLEDYPDFKPGDVFCIAAGQWGGFRFVDFHATDDNPFIIKNCGGLVEIAEARYDGIAFHNCRYFHLTGTGVDGISHGIKITDGARGIEVKEVSSDAEIDHIEIEYSRFSGIVIKTDPICDRPETHMGDFLMKNISVHDNLIYEVDGEGIYAGYSGGYEETNIYCDDEPLFGHLIENIEIYDNYLRGNGWDGIQVKRAYGEVYVHHNTVIDYARLQVRNQKNGIYVADGFSGHVFNNV